MLKSLMKPIVILAGMAAAFSAMAEVAKPEVPDTFAERKFVLQISDRDPSKQVLTLNVVGNLLTYYQGEEVDIEVVAFGPGINFLKASNKNAERVKIYMDAGVRFSACEKTLNSLAAKLGEKIELQDGVTVVPAGAPRIFQLQDAGWKLLKP